MNASPITVEILDGAGAGRFTVNSIRELNELLDRESRRAERDEYFVLASIERAAGDMLLIGLGGEATSIEYYFGDGSDTSLGAVREGESEPVSFFAYGDESEYPPQCAIPIDVARQIIREYVEAGTLSKLVQWEPA